VRYRKLSLPVLFLFAIFSPLYSETHIAKLDRVVDGDTITLATNKRVRLIGIDCPEKHPSDKLIRALEKTNAAYNDMSALADRSTDMARGMYPSSGGDILLEFDEERRDQYERLLAYVYVPYEKMFSGAPAELIKIENGKKWTMVNGELIRRGYARAYVIPPNLKYARSLQSLEWESRRLNRGLWRDPLFRKLYKR